MYLSDHDIDDAIRAGTLIVDPPGEIGPTSVDLHLDDVGQAKVWNLALLEERNRDHGHSPRELRIARADYGRVSKLYLKDPPHDRDKCHTDGVFRRDMEVIIRPGGFVLWQTKERVGTPAVDPRYICFIDGKSTRARTGLVVHLTAPNIHAGWSGKITLEICNLGPLDIVLCENDVVAQITVAQVSSPPFANMSSSGSRTQGQTSVFGMGAQ
ncbi:MAG: hypothetical protein HOP29_15170 [Phycisphaerales bacterium]|nr:hypothetical protein [Phycisphaerales bacterium]